MYKVLTPSIITPHINYYGLMCIVWAHLGTGVYRVKTKYGLKMTLLSQQISLLSLT